jgi:hypothetical protein
MARNEDIVNTIWDDLDHLGDDAFMLYVWSWTNLKCGMAGIYPVARRKLIEGRFDDARLTAALAELEGDEKLFYLEGVLWNKARVSRLSGYVNSKLSETIAKSIARDLKQIKPANPLLGRFLERYGSHPNLEGELAPFRPPLGGLIDQVAEPNRRPSRGGLETPPCQGEGQGQGEGLVNQEEREKEIPGEHRVVLGRLDQVAFSRSLPPPKIEAAVKAIGEFGDRDLDIESDRFAHYYTEGAGENRPMRDVVEKWREWLRSAPSKVNATRRAGTKKSSTKDRAAYAQVEPAT